MQATKPSITLDTALANSSLNNSPLTTQSANTTPNTSYTPIMPGESSTRRQRIAMACQYCRHRKIKCCGSSPCANCTRARRSCDYQPVPEEVNRATREKKAAAKAAKSAFVSQRAAPYFVGESPMYGVGMSYLGHGPIRGTHVPARRSYSTPINMSMAAMSPYSPVPHSAPPMSSAQFEHQGWFNAPPVPVINVSPMVPVMPHVEAPMTVPVPSVPTLPNVHEQNAVEESSAYATYAAAPVSPTESSASTSYAMPVTPTPNILTYTPQPFPFSPSPLAQSTFASSPTLCPGLSVPQQKQQPAHPQQQQPQQQPLVGLGIGLGAGDEGVYVSNVQGHDYMNGGVWVQPDASPYLQ